MGRGSVRLPPSFQGGGSCNARSLGWGCRRLKTVYKRLPPTHRNTGHANYCISLLGSCSSTPIMATYGRRGAHKASPGWLRTVLFVFLALVWAQYESGAQTPQTSLAGGAPQAPQKKHHPWNVWENKAFSVTFTFTPGVRRLRICSGCQ
jgi:hypothetical protein